MRDITYTERKEILGRKVKKVGDRAKLKRDGLTWNGEITKVYKSNGKVYAYDFWKY